MLLHIVKLQCITRLGAAPCRLAPSSLRTAHSASGSYELQYFSSVRTELEKQAGKPSANFRPLEFVDRFGRSMAAPSFDAAADQTMAAEPVKGGFKGRTSHSAGAAPKRISWPAKGVSAPFVSLTAGHAEYDLKAAGRAPGPAYYSPEQPDKRSHHLNARKRQVP